LYSKLKIILIEEKVSPKELKETIFYFWSRGYFLFLYYICYIVVDIKKIRILLLIKIN